MLNPAQFRRITPEEEITVPCVLARLGENGNWWSIVAYMPKATNAIKHKYTHWLPIEFPEVRG